MHIVSHSCIFERSGLVWRPASGKRSGILERPWRGAGSAGVGRGGVRRLMHDEWRVRGAENGKTKKPFCLCCLAGGVTAPGMGASPFRSNESPGRKGEERPGREGRGNCAAAPSGIPPGTAPHTDTRQALAGFGCQRPPAERLGAAVRLFGLYHGEAHGRPGRNGQLVAPPVDLQPEPSVTGGDSAHLFFLEMVRGRPLRVTMRTPAGPLETAFRFDSPPGGRQVRTPKPSAAGPSGRKGARPTQSRETSPARSTAEKLLLRQAAGPANAGRPSRSRRARVDWLPGFRGASARNRRAHGPGYRTATVHERFAPGGTETQCHRALSRSSGPPRSQRRRLCSACIRRTRWAPAARTDP